ncbi:hypothetical protein VCHA53O466_50073 [Vibrio chagasii]|nr:hypothetical protein VCHA53O466_50073 [Vibrio chagasii]
MFVLNPSNKTSFEFQWKQVFYNIWLTHFDQQTSVSSNATIESRRHRFGLRGNRYANLIAEMYGYSSWSELVISQNITSNSSANIHEHPFFHENSDELHHRVLSALSGRHQCALKDSTTILADTFIDSINTIKSLPESKSVYSEYPVTSMMDQLMRRICDSGLSLGFPVGVVAEDKDRIAPAFDEYGEIIYDESPYYSLIEDGVEVDCEVPITVSPCFSNLDDAEEFFIKKAPLYCQYLTNLDARLIDRTALKVSNISGFIYQ